MKHFDHFHRHAAEHAIVLGNGASRRDINLAAAVDDAVMTGCNAIYREWIDLDYIAAVDHHMLEELGGAGPFEDTEVFTSYGKIVPWIVHWAPMGQRQKLSGQLAVMLAASMGCSVIWVAGFDMDGTNTFKGSQHYKGRAVDQREQPVMAELHQQMKVMCRKLEIEVPRVIQIGPFHTIEWMEFREVPPEWVK